MIAGLFDGLKQLNPNNKLYGFLNGPSGLIEGNYLELTSPIIDEYRNKYVKTLKNRTEKTYAEKVYNYLKNVVGVPKEQLDAVIRILKISAGETVAYTMPAIPAGHVHTPGSAETVLYTADRKSVV